MPGPEADLTLLTAAARKAGEIALGFWQASPEVWDKPDGQGPVTEADLAVDAMLRDMLLSARPGHGWLSEESPDDTARLDRRDLFIVDPIDGTRAFIAGEADFSHALAIAREGRITAAVVYLPARDLLFAATDTESATCNGVAIRPSDRIDPDGAHVLAPKGAFTADRWPGGVPDVTRAFRSSIAYRLCLVAEGRFDAVLTFRPSWEWDIAAGSLIAAQAGATVSDAEGAPLRFNRPDPRTPGVFAAPPGLHRAMMARRQP